jgi:hypothetical protein
VIYSLQFFFIICSSSCSRCRTIDDIQSDSELLSRFGFTGHGNTDNNLESLCIFNVFKPGRSQHSAQWIWSNQLTDIRIVVCVWIIAGP